MTSVDNTLVIAGLKVKFKREKYSTEFILSYIRKLMWNLKTFMGTEQGFLRKIK
jgi:hypothetical protein